MQAVSPSYTNTIAESKENGNFASQNQKKSSISKDKKITSIYSDDDDGDDEDNDEDNDDDNDDKEEVEGGSGSNVQNSNLAMGPKPDDHSGPKSQSSNSSSGGGSNRKTEVRKILSTLPSTTRTVDYER